MYNRDVLCDAVRCYAIRRDAGLFGAVAVTSGIVTASARGAVTVRCVVGSYVVTGCCAFCEFAFCEWCPRTVHTALSTGSARR